jgi:hypothetical protein
MAVTTVWLTAFTSAPASNSNCAILASSLQEKGKPLSAHGKGALLIVNTQAS